MWKRKPRCVQCHHHFKKLIDGICAMCHGLSTPVSPDVGYDETDPDDTALDKAEISSLEDQYRKQQAAQERMLAAGPMHETGRTAHARAIEIAERFRRGRSLRATQEAPEQGPKQQAWLPRRPEAPEEEAPRQRELFDDLRWPADILQIDVKKLKSILEMKPFHDAENTPRLAAEWKETKIKDFEQYGQHNKLNQDRIEVGLEYCWLHCFLAPFDAKPAAEAVKTTQKNVKAVNETLGTAIPYGRAVFGVIGNISGLQVEPAMATE
ncbi:hypothetical protein GN244_ATG00772 [Phytophthora infestans]|uniref:Uncharacterized protein n=1 Tax=Phytophthora infestans TaxID=4787 RepID=A0A833T346_PHYIN|nr:hypothetical protein GN244_ATG00772 [Phytophthora infestans]KAF4130442.1 hypothetical protein GN958_ATG20336 [Phytophthora infestans]